MTSAKGMKLWFWVPALACVFLVGCGDEEEPVTPGPAAGGTFWVIDQPDSEVAIYDYDGKLRYVVERFPFFKKPNCVDVDERDGSAWVLDYYANKVRKFNCYGRLLYETPGYEEGEPLVRRGTSIAVDSATGACWVADRSHNRILKLGENGKLLATVTGFQYPRVVSLVPEVGDCWVADELNDRVVKLPAAVTGEVAMGEVALATCGDFDIPCNVCADADGGVWVIDTGVASVVKISNEGVRAAEVTGFDWPYDVVSSKAAHTVYVVDYELGSLVAFSRGVSGTQAMGKVAKLTVAGLDAPTDVELDEEGGYVFVASSDAVRRYTTSGNLVQTYAEMQLPVMVAADPAREY
jgi:DNA-binding beta-propeller fold protein YncE